MSQYPYPPGQYPQPGGPPYVQPPRDPLAAARRASVMMWILGTMAVLLGLCMAALFGPMIETAMRNTPPAEAERMREQFAQLERQAGMPMTTVMLVSGVVMIVAGGVLGTLAFFVRGGGRVAPIVSAVLTGLALGYLAISVVLSIFQGQGVGAACVGVVGGSLLILLMIWLIQAARSAPRVEQARAQYDFSRAQFENHVQPPSPPYSSSSATPPAPGAMPPSQPPSVGPGDTGGRYGYATRPPPPADALPPSDDQSPPPGA